MLSRPTSTQGRRSLANGRESNSIFSWTGTMRSRWCEYHQEVERHSPAPIATAHAPNDDSCATWRRSYLGCFGFIFVLWDKGGHLCLGHRLKTATTLPNLTGGRLNEDLNLKWTLNVKVLLSRKHVTRFSGLCLVL